MKLIKGVFVLFTCAFITKCKASIIAKAGLIPCETDVDCDDLHNAKCDDSFCKCLSAKDFLCPDSTRIVVNKLQENCQTDLDCNIQFAECDRHRKCACKDGRIGSSDGRQCLKISKGIGDSCEDSVQCYTVTPYTGCRENKCLCQQHMHESNGSCYKNVGLGGSCDKNEECSLTHFSSCANAKCACVDKYVTSGSRCLPVAHDWRSTCEEDVQCTGRLGPGSQCSNHACRCKELYHPKLKTRKCVRDIFLDEYCRNHSECHQPGAGLSRLECILGVCKCKSSYVEKEGYCISSIDAVSPPNIVYFVFICFVLYLYF